MTRDPRPLIEHASQGDAGAIQELLVRYLPGLERFVRRRAHGVVLAHESGSDLVQSVCREVLERLAVERIEYRGEAEFRKWLHQAALFKIQNRYRYRVADRRAGEPRPGAGSAGDDSNAGPAEALFRTLSTPSDDAMLREGLVAFERAFAQLPENYRQVLSLAHLEGRTHREIAATLSISEAHSRVLLARAIARLGTLGALELD